MKNLVKIILILPLLIAWLLDRDFSCQAHVPLIGIVAICVSLCDALFGQIISNTRWIPFCACYTPSEAQQLAKRFRAYHNRLFFSWIMAKVCSMLSIAFSAVLVIKEMPKVLSDCRVYFIAAGYLTLGVALMMAVKFIITHLAVVKESDDARLREMNFAYKRDNPGLFKQNPEVVNKQLKGFASGYTSNPQTAATVP